MNRLYNVINDDPELKRDIKFIGVAAGNKTNEAEAYKKKLRVPFPLFPDPLGMTWQILGKPGTPTMIVCNRNGKVLTVHTGIIEDLDSFLGEIREIHKNL